MYYITQTHTYIILGYVYMCVYIYISFRKHMLKGNVFLRYPQYMYIFETKNVNIYSSLHLQYLKIAYGLKLNLL